MLHTMRSHSRHKANKRRTKKNEKLETNSLCKVSVCLFFAFSWCHFTQRNSLHFVVAEVHIGTIVISSIRNTERETWCAFLDMKCPQSNAINKHVLVAVPNDWRMLSGNCA